jgi:hypothetical protein
MQNPAPDAFDRPGGESSRPSKPRPIDLDHLSGQTLADRAVEEEVLAVFAHEALLVRERILQADPAERTRLAHALKGLARSVGAFALAECADEIESRPDDRMALRRITAAIDEVSDFIAAISR